MGFDEFKERALIAYTIVFLSLNAKVITVAVTVNGGKCCYIQDRPKNEGLDKSCIITICSGEDYAYLYW
jgi:hypothetical protein